MRAPHELKKRKPIRNAEKTSLKQKFFSVLLAIIIGMILGILAKLVDNPRVNQIFDGIGGRLGIWVFVATLLAVYARTPGLAATRVFAFFGSMLFTYYIYTIYFLHFFPKRQIIFWSLCALLTPLCGFVVWFAHGEGLFADFCAAIPIAVIASEAYVSCESDLLLQAVYLCWIIILVVIRKKRYLSVCILSLILFLILVKINLLKFLFGGWNLML